MVMAAASACHVDERRDAGMRHGVVRKRTPSAGRLADDCHIVRIAAEGCNVVAHETQRLDLVEQTKISRTHAREIQKAESAEAIVDRDCNHVAVRGETIVPVPLHPRRLWQRRYNQSAILARRLAKLTGKPTDPEMVWEIACAELCGWGHYRMIGRAFIHDTEADFLAWLNWAAAHQNDFGKTK